MMLKSLFCTLLVLPLVANCSDMPAPSASELLSAASTDANTGIDMGTGVMWAPYNLGARSPFEHGLLICWGERVEKPCDSCTWEGYSFVTDSALVRYRLSETSGTFDRTELLPSDDAATCILGDGWRLPTEAEFMALNRTCSWAWHDDYDSTGCAGYLAISRRTGRSLFFPAAGFKSAEQCMVGDHDGSAYWTSTLDTVRESGRLAVAFEIHPSRVDVVSVPRYWAHSVRPVRVRQ